MTAVSLDSLEKRFGSFEVLRDLDLVINEGESYVLLGPSGCGKTTTLRIVAGLEMPTGGRMTIGGTPVYSRDEGIWIPTERRPIGMVFQSYALWPSMSVAENVRFTLSHGRTRLTRAKARERCAEVLELMQIGHLAERKIMQLSGGQQQRVALARAIAQRPRILLMDEPLSNLDPQLRSDVRGEIRKLCKSLGTTAVIVTHDRDDALGLADRVGVMSEGQILQEAPPSEVMNAPGSLFIARIFGEMNTLPARIAGIDAGNARVTFAGMTIAVPAEDWMQVGASAFACARPASLRLSDRGLAGTVVESHPEGHLHRNRIDVNGSQLIVYHQGAPLSQGARTAISSSDGRWFVFPA